MSNNWYYKIFFGKEIAFQERIVNVFETLRLNDLHLTQSPKSPIIIFDPISAKDLEFFEEFAAVEYLSKKGGLLQLWYILDPSTDWGVDFHIDFKTPQTLPKVQPFLQEDLIGELTISIGDYMYRQHDPEDNDREAIASVIKRLYRDLCINQNAIYGFSTDEYMVEEYADKLSKILPDILSGKASPTLFWLNYFSDKTPPEVVRERISLVHGDVETLGHGIFVSFFDYPWEVNISNLIQINNQWSQLDYGNCKHSERPK